ncbi:MAG TPA: cadherin-like domain-containing protein [Burkholderiaceae bacterium]|nr:cadherin-like domain-containing protein [Burkholderiaceae bacterium]
MLTGAVVDSTSQVTISGTYDGLAVVRTYRIEFFASPSADASGYGEGQRYLGFADVVTDGTGSASFSVALSATVGAGEVISATATDSVLQETSEFSACVVATNTAPTLDGSKSPALVAQNEDSGAPSGAVGTLVSSLVDYATPAGQVDNVTDPDPVPLLGIAITGADASNGAWWYSSDNGASWNALGAVSTASARLLAADGSTRIYFQPNADYNGTQASAITFRAWDRTSGANGGSADTTVNGGMTAFSVATDTASLTVNPVNDAPVLTGVNLTVSEGQTVTLNGANIGITDVDSAAFTYTLSGLAGGLFQLSGAPGLAVSSFTSAQLSAGQVQFVDDGNEVAPAFSLTASDGSASSNTLAASITYTPVNDAPVLVNTPLTLTVAEDAGAPTGAVGSLVSAFTGGVSDADVGAARGIAITASDEANGIWYYSTDGGTNWNAVGAVSNASALLLADDGNTRLYFAPAANYNGTSGAALTLRAWDRTSGVAGTKVDASSNGGSSALSSATDVVDVTVTAVNDPPVITSDGGGASAALNVAENTTAVTTVTATDVDTGGTLTYSITGGVDAARFTINPSTGALSFVVAPDFEAPSDAGGDNVYDVLVQVSDGALIDSQAIAVSVTNANEVPVNAVPGAQTVAEDGTLAIGGVSVTDPDNNVSTVRLTVVQGNLSVNLAGGASISAGANNSATLTLSGTTGQINAALGTLAYAPNANYNGADALSVVTTDALGLADTDTVAISVSPVNDAPVLTGVSLTVSEGQTVTLSPANIGIADVDSAAFTYTVSGLAGGLFQLSSAPGVAISNFTSAQLSSGLVQFVDDGNEVAPAFSLTASDGNASSNTLAASVTYTPVNDAPVFTSFGGAASATVAQAENQTAAASLSATDADGDVLTFSIVGGADSARFTINATTGVLTFATPPDFEAPADVGADNGYDVTVQVSDGAQAATQAIRVNVGNVNEAPTALQISGDSVVERSAAGTVVGTVRAIDPDAGDLFSFSLVADANGRFAIDPASGQLRVANAAALDFASASQHTLIVQVTDAGGLSYQQSVVVQVMPIIVQRELPGFTPPPPPAVAPSTTIEVAVAAPVATGGAAAGTVPSTLTLRGGGASVPQLEATPVRVAIVDDGADGAHMTRGLERPFKLRQGVDGAPYTLSFGLFSPDELQGQSPAADESSLQRSVDALLKQSFGFTRGSVQLDDVPAEGRESSATESILRVVTDPVKVSSVAFTAGFVWWLTRGGGLLATMLMGIPAWRHIDLAPVLARQLDDDDEDDHELDLLASDSELSRLDALSEYRLRSLMDDPSLQSMPGELDGAAADLFQPHHTRVPAGERR